MFWATTAWSQNTPTPTITPTPGTGSCCTVQLDPSCDDAACVACVCDFDSYCCLTAWDHQCSLEALGQYTVLGTCSCACATDASTPTPTQTPSFCVGDCDDNGEVTQAEVNKCVGILGGSVPLDECYNCDENGDYEVFVNEVNKAAQNHTNGCPGGPTRTPTPTATKTPTRTFTPTITPTYVLQTYSHGCYIGTGDVGQQVINVGLTPSLLMIKAEGPQPMVFWTDNLAAGPSPTAESFLATGYFGASGESPIISVSGSSVTLASSSNTSTYIFSNKNNTKYCWFAFKEYATFGNYHLHLSTYTGDGTDNRLLSLTADTSSSAPVVWTERISDTVYMPMIESRSDMEYLKFLKHTPTPASPTPTPTGTVIPYASPRCCGDVDGNNYVLHDEVLICLDYLHSIRTGYPTACDNNGDAEVDVGELTLAITHEAQGCPGFSTGYKGVFSAFGQPADTMVNYLNSNDQININKNPFINESGKNYQYIQWAPNSKDIEGETQSTSAGISHGMYVGNDATNRVVPVSCDTAPKMVYLWAEDGVGGRMRGSEPLRRGKTHFLGTFASEDGHIVALGANAIQNSIGGSVVSFTVNNKANGGDIRYFWLALCNANEITLASTQTPTAVPTNTPKKTPTRTPTVTQTRTKTQTPTVTITPTRTPTPLPERVKAIFLGIRGPSVTYSDISPKSLWNQ
jgi:hypothetical protein